MCNNFWLCTRPECSSSYPWQNGFGVRARNNPREMIAGWLSYHQVVFIVARTPSLAGEDVGVSLRPSVLLLLESDVVWYAKSWIPSPHPPQLPARRPPPVPPPAFTSTGSLCYYYLAEPFCVDKNNPKKGRRSWRLPCRSLRSSRWAAQSLPSWRLSRRLC